MRALSSYHKTDYTSAIKQLRPFTDARSLILLGQAYLMNDQARQAIETFEKAIALDPSSSLAYDWLGRKLRTTRINGISPRRHRHGNARP